MRGTRLIIAVLAVLLALFSTLSSAYNPGLRGGINGAGLSAAIEVIDPIIVDELKKLELPEFHDRVDTPIGDIDLSLINMQLKSFAWGKIQLMYITNPPGLGINIPKIKVNFGSDWKFKRVEVPRIFGSGEADITLEVVNLNVTVGVKEVNGKPVFTTETSEVIVENVDIDISGGLFSWLYNVFIRFFNKTITKSVKEGIRNGIRKAIDEVLNNAIAKEDFIVPIPPIQLVNFTLSEQPEVKQNVMSQGLDGSIFTVFNPTLRYPEEPKLLPPITGNAMAEVLVSEYLFRSAGFAIAKADLVSFTFTNDDIPSTIPVDLRTPTWCATCPELCNQYPDHNMELELTFTKVPSFDILPQTGLNFTGQFDMEFVVINNGKKEFIFDVELTAGLSVNVDVVENALNLEYEYQTLLLSVTNSSVGTCNMQALEMLGQIFVMTVGVPYLNDVAGYVPLPVMSGAHLVNAAIETHDGHFRIQSDIAFDGLAERLRMAMASRDKK